MYLIHRALMSSDLLSFVSQTMSGVNMLRSRDKRITRDIWLYLGPVLLILICECNLSYPYQCFLLMTRYQT